MSYVLSIVNISIDPCVYLSSDIPRIVIGALSRVFYHLIITNNRILINFGALGVHVCFWRYHASSLPKLESASTTYSKRCDIEN